MQRYLIILFVLIGIGAHYLFADESVAFTTTDGIIIAGDYQPPRQAGKRVAVMLHGLGSTSGEWTALKRLIVAEGLGYFAYDARGHGRSTKTTTGTEINYTQFGPPGDESPWYAMIGDLDQAVRYLARVKKIKETSLVIVGASLGANIAIAWAADHQSVAAVLLLSPGIEYAGIRSSGPAGRFLNRKIAFAAAPNDTYAFQSSRALYNHLASNPHATFFLGVSGHGVQMFDGKFEEGLARWLSK